jgi:CheY-like chemotaxis protein
MAAILKSQKPAVLAIDDRRANLLALDALLADEFSVVHAGSGEEALAILARGTQVDLVLLDVQMPGMDGFETAAAIKKLDFARDVPIIFITAVYSEDPYVKKGYESGGIDYFSKPFDPEILKLKVRIYTSFRAREAMLRQRERQVRESEELLRVGRKLSSVLESLSVGVLIADIKGRVFQTTDEVSRIFNADEALANDSYGEMLGWWDRDGRMITGQGGPLARALVDGASHHETVAIQCVDGSTKKVRVSASALRGLDNVLMGAVVLIQDMTTPAQFGEALERRVARLIGTGLELEQTAVRGD